MIILKSDYLLDYHLNLILLAYYLLFHQELKKDSLENNFLLEELLLMYLNNIRDMNYYSTVTSFLKQEKQ